MREVEGRTVALLNPEDAATHPDWTVFGLPIVEDPDVPPGFVRFRTEVPPGIAAAAEVMWIDGDALHADGPAGH
jgi:hypothetical protein